MNFVPTSGKRLRYLRPQPNRIYNYHQLEKKPRVHIKFIKLKLRCTKQSAFRGINLMPVGFVPYPNGRSIIGFAWFYHIICILYIYLLIYVFIYILYIYILYIIIYIIIYIYIIHYQPHNWIGLEGENCSAVFTKKNGGPHTRFESRKEQDIQCQT